MKFRISAIQKRNLSKVLPFAFFAMGAGFLFALIEKGLLGESNTYPSTGNYYDFGVNIIVTISAGFVLGAVVGVTEALLINRMFGKSSFVLKVLAKSFIYISLMILTIAGLGLIANSFQMGMPFYRREVLASIVTFLTNFAFVSIIIYVGACITVMLFISELSDYLGQGAFRNYVLGKYKRSREEERIFMFLDMRSSTTIAEDLGHVGYFEFLNEYYTDMVEYILQYDGEIYQYVGDEIIVSWSVPENEKSVFRRSLQCFFAIHDMMNERHGYYETKYGIRPEFKAGVHFGHVTTGEIGQIKKAIVFTGDVLNTTARIQGMCNTVNEDLLVSAMFRSMSIDSGEFQFTSVGDIRLRGKRDHMELFAVERHG